MADMQELIARLEVADKGSRELDALVWKALNPKGEIAIKGAGRPGLVDWRCRIPGATIANSWTNPGRYTTSLDAALALAERLMPGQEYEITTLYNVARVTLNVNHGEDGGPFYGCNVCCNVPLAVCAAVLKSILNGYEAAGEVSPILKAKAQGEGG